MAAEPETGARNCTREVAPLGGARARLEQADNQGLEMRCGV